LGTFHVHETVLSVMRHTVETVKAPTIEPVARRRTLRRGAGTAWDRLERPQPDRPRDRAAIRHTPPQAPSP